MGKNNLIVPGFDEQKCNHVEMKLQKIDAVDECLAIHLTGYIDSYNSLSFQKKIGKVIEARFIRLIFNCEGLNYISSIGIESFTTLFYCIKKKGGDIVLINIQPKVRNVFELLGFSSFFQIADNLNEAYRLFPGKRESKKEAVFPKIFNCPICSKRLRAPKFGRFRCADCKAIFVINDKGDVFLG